MSTSPGDERMALARLIPELKKRMNDPDALGAWIMTLTEAEQPIIIAWAIKQQIHYTQMASRVDDTFKYINRNIDRDLL
jgi:hypothetical protein